MAVTFTYAINAGYFQTSSYSGQGFVTINNDTSDTIFITSITAPMGTGNAYYNSPGEITGNGGEITVYGSIASSYTTNTATISNRIGQSGDPEYVYFYPTYSQCVDVTLTFSTPVPLGPGSVGVISFYFNGSGNCFVWRRADITGTYITQSNTYTLQYSKNDDVTNPASWNYNWLGTTVTSTNTVVGSGIYCYISNPTEIDIVSGASTPTDLDVATIYNANRYGGGISQGTIIILPLVRNGYSFAGWYITNMTASYHWTGNEPPWNASLPADFDGAIAYDVQLPYNTVDFIQTAFLRNSSGTTFLTARWSPQISFNNNSGSGSMSSIYVNYYDGATVPVCTFTPPTSKQFVEWNTQSDGQGTSYAVGTALQSSNPSGSNYIEEPTTLYAIWESPHPDWYWYSQAQDPTKILAGEPTTNAPASRFYNGTTGLQDDIKQYINPSYVPITTLVSGSAMKASDFNHASSELGMSAVTAGTVIQAQKFIDIRDALNNHFNS